MLPAILGAMGTVGSFASGMGSLIGGVSSMFGGGGDSGHDARRMMRMQRANQLDDLYWGPTRTIQGLEKAGLNPALYYGGGAGNTQPMPSPSPVYPPDDKILRANSAREGMLATAQVAKLAADTEASKSVAELNRATAIRTDVQTQMDTANAGLAHINLDERKYLRDLYGSFDVKGRELSANDFENIYRKELAVRNVLSTSHMDKLAQDLGFPNFVTGSKNLAFRKEFQDLVLQQFSMPKASAEHDFYLTTFGKSIAPYLNSAESMSRSIRPFTK